MTLSTASPPSNPTLIPLRPRPLTLLTTTQPLHPTGSNLMYPGLMCQTPLAGYSKSRNFFNTTGSLTQSGSRSHRFTWMDLPSRGFRGWPATINFPPGQGFFRRLKPALPFLLTRTQLGNSSSWFRKARSENTWLSSSLWPIASPDCHPLRS